MENVKQNKMGVAPMKKLFWKMGIPMIISMILQALYNVVDSIFVANMGEEGALANQALTIAFPIQILIIAIGVGTGVGINTLLSKSLGEKNGEKANKVAGNGIFLSLCIYLFFLIFGLFGSKWFISLFANGNETVIEMGTTYLQICSCFSLGSIGYAVYERFLQSTGKTMYSTIAQISGAVANIVLDYVFIFPCKMGVAGAAWATIIGQFLSLFIAMIFHYAKNKEINGHIKYLKPSWSVIKEIYKIGISAALMQALLAVMMAGMNAILNLADADATVLVGAFGIYYKIQQIALFAAFGLSNTIISILSFNYGMRDKKRIDDCIKYGIFDSVIVCLIITVLFEALANPLSKLFGLTGESTTEIISICTVALRISSIGYIFMGFSVAVQGILQALGYATKPLVISLLRLAVFVFPVAYLFTLSANVENIVWWTFPIAEILTSVVSLVFLIRVYKKKISVITENVKPSMNLIVSISRQHGTNGKQIGRLVAQRLGIDFFDKELIAEGAKEYDGEKYNLVGQNVDDEIYSLFLSLDANKESIIAQSEVIREIADKRSCVIVGRASDYILRDNPNLIKVFLYAPMEYKVQTVMKIYGDDEKSATEHVQKSDRARADYYSLITNQEWGKKENYDLCLDCSIGNDKVVDVICDFVNSHAKH